MSHLGLYRPGRSPLHRAPAGAKLAALVLAAALVLWLHHPAQLAVAALATVLLAVVAGIGWRVGLAQLRPLWWFLVPLFALHWVNDGVTRATVVVGQLLVLVALAALVTLTTRVSAMLEVLQRGLRPLARIGVSPTRVALVLALTVRCVPLVAAAYHEAREAQRARSLERSPRALVVPLVIRLLKKADTLGEALTARGVDDEE